MSDRGGYGVLPCAVMDRTDISTYAKMTYVALSSFAGLPEVRPGHKRLAEIVGCSPRKIADALEELRSQELVEWKTVSTPKGRVSVYRTIQPWTGGGVLQEVQDPLGGDAPGARRGDAPGASEVTKEQVTRKTSSSELRPDVERICEHLADRIEANGSKRPTITEGWRRSARLLLDRDGKTEAQVHTCIDWCQADSFWQANILSMPKLREKYDQLRLRAQAEQSEAKKSRPLVAVPAYVETAAPPREALTW